MQTAIDEIRREAEQEIAGLSAAAELEQFRIRYLARKGKVAHLYDELRNAPADQRPALGKAINELRAQLEILLESKVAGLLQPIVPGMPAKKSPPRKLCCAAKRASFAPGTPAWA